MLNKSRVWSLWLASFLVRLKTYQHPSYVCMYICMYVCQHLWNVTYLLTYSMEQSPSWEAYRFSASQKFPCSLWNLNVDYCIYKFLSPIPILSQINPVHVPSFHFLKSHLNTILPSMPRSSKWSLSLRLPHQKPSFPHTSYMHRSYQYSWFDHLNNIWWGVQIIKILV